MLHAIQPHRRFCNNACTKRCRFACIGWREKRMDAPLLCKSAFTLRPEYGISGSLFHQDTHKTMDLYSISANSARTFFSHVHTGGYFQCTRAEITLPPVCDWIPCTLASSRKRSDRVPATGTRSPRIAYRQSLWLADVWHATGLQGTGAELQPSRSQNQNGVGVQVLAIFFGTRSLVKG